MKNILLRKAILITMIAALLLGGTAGHRLHAAEPQPAFRMASIFTDHMVLQREQPLPIWGWEKVTDNYATGNQLQYSDDTKIWTEMVSHGEVIRSGYDEKMEYDPKNCRWLIQGILKSESNVDYPSLPWKLGIIKLEK